MALLVSRIFPCCRSQMLNYATLKKSEPGIMALGKTTKKGKAAGVTGKMVFDVETDANRIVNYVCGSNILKEGGEDIKLKPDSEYPEWLWTLRLGKAPTLQEMDPNTLEYWKKVRKLARKRNQYLQSVRRF